MCGVLEISTGLSTAKVLQGSGVPFMRGNGERTQRLTKLASVFGVPHEWLTAAA